MSTQTLSQASRSSATVEQEGTSSATDRVLSDEDTLKEVLYSMGATEETLFEYLDKLNKQWDDMFALMPGGRMRELGVRTCPLLTFPQNALTLSVN